MNNERGIGRGKDFEQIIRQAFLDVLDTTVIRLPDPTNGYLGVRNPADFLIYHCPYQYFIECKTTHTTRLPFNNITFNQWHGMLDASKVKGVIAGVICWYVGEDLTIFVPIQVLEKMKQAGEKSLNMKKLPAGTIKIKGTKKRIFFDYDIGSFIEHCNKFRLGEKNYGEF